MHIFQLHTKSEVKVCLGWFGLTKHKVPCEKASVAATDEQADGC